MSDFFEMAEFIRRFGNAENNQPETKVCALTKKFNCVCPVCDRKAEQERNVCEATECTRQGPTL